LFGSKKQDGKKHIKAGNAMGNGTCTNDKCIAYNFFIVFINLSFQRQDVE